LFDRVLCDVPCSSDAAIRKLPQKWGNWGTRESQSLHPLQIQLFKRGLELLKVGGKMSYSTCSLSPIEDESVVAAVLKHYGDAIRLLKVELPGFKF
jgi:16S rRNA C967 or C1407 C5-methylase (RsmB/RsmF family)